MQVGVADRRHHVGAHRTAELHGGRAHPTGGSGDEHPVAGTQAGLGDQGVLGGREHLGEPAGVDQVDPVGHRQDGRLGHHHLLGLAAAPADGHDPVAEGEPHGAGSERPHRSRELHARDVGGPPGGCRIEAPALEHVGPVETGGRRPPPATSPGPGTGSGCSSQRSSPSTMVTARMRRAYRRRPRVHGWRPCETVTASSPGRCGRSAWPSSLLGCAPEGTPMTTEPHQDDDHEERGRSASVRRRRRSPVDDRFPEPTAGMVLHRVLALSARTFLLNDLGDALDDGTRTCDPRGRAQRSRWGPDRCGPSPSVESLQGTERRPDRPNGSIRAGWPCAGSARTSAPSVSSSTRGGAPRCGPSWPGTETNSAGPGTSTCWPRSSGPGVPRCSNRPRRPGCWLWSTGSGTRWPTPSPATGSAPAGSS